MILSKGGISSSVKVSAYLSKSATIDWSSVPEVVGVAMLTIAYWSIYSIEIAVLMVATKKTMAFYMICIFFKQRP